MARCHRFQGAVPKVGWNQRDGCRTTVEGEVDGFPGPRQCFGVGLKGRFDEDERTQGDFIFSQKFRSGRELIESHSLVQSFQGLRMCRFQPHGDFQSTLQQIVKTEHGLTDQGWM